MTAQSQTEAPLAFWRPGFLSTCWGYLLTKCFSASVLPPATQSSHGGLPPKSGCRAHAGLRRMSASASSGEPTMHAFASGVRDLASRLHGSAEKSMRRSATPTGAPILHTPCRMVILRRWYQASAAFLSLSGACTSAPAASISRARSRRPWYAAKRSGVQPEARSSCTPENLILAIHASRGSVLSREYHSRVPSSILGFMASSMRNEKMSPCSSTARCFLSIMSLMSGPR
mmetsp:Transcript_54464/g.155102  ORF Transcript_54464/g.155102 Transcript_54464/m.155102 type:complete len:230 (+) Transcript_54464:2-691(+)